MCIKCGSLGAGGRCICITAEETVKILKDFVKSDRTISIIPTGVKNDQDKPDLSLISTIAITKVAEVMTFGKRKYSAHNWRGGFYWSRPLAAALRHVFAYIGGEDKDPETGLSHLAHACCCLFFILEFEETHIELDDRFKKPESK